MAWNILTGDKDAKPKYTVGICIPNRGEVQTAFFMAFNQLQKPQSFVIQAERGHQIDTSRNLQVSGVLARGGQYVFFLDSDVHPQPNVLNDLLALELPIVSAVYFNRGTPYHMLAQAEGVPFPHELAGAPELRQATSVGMGCCLIDTRVFHRLGANLPWRCLRDHKPELKKTSVYKTTYPEAKAYGFRCPMCKQLLMAPFFKTTLGYVDENPLSEDYYFCEQARNMGFPIFVKMDALCEHEVMGMTIGAKGLTNETKIIGEGMGEK